MLKKAILRGKIKKNLAQFFGEILTSFLTSPYLWQTCQNQTNFRTKFGVWLSFEQAILQDIDRNAKSL